MKTVFIFFINFFVVFSAFTQPGTLDKSFGDTGVVITPVYGGLQALGLQSNGRIIAGGALIKDVNNSIYGSVLVGYLPSGQLDNSFGDEGISFVNDQKDVASVAITAYNKIITINSNDDITITQYSPDGKPDSAFGENGRVHHLYSGIDAISPKAIKIQEDGKIVITGAAYFLDEDQAYEPKIITARFNADGSIDESFAGVGYALLDYKIANALVVLPDGKIIIGGNTGLEEKFIIACYLPDGNLDEAFGDKGINIVNFNNQRDYINALDVQPDGKIVAAGVENYLFGNMIAARFLSNGTLDESFGNGGFTLIKFQNGSQARTMALQNDGRIILGGYSNPSVGIFYFALAALDKNGMIDSSFGASGLVETNIEGKEYGRASVLQPDGKIVLAGMNTTATNFVLARYNNGAQNKPIALIKKWIKNHILHWQNVQTTGIAAYAIEQSNAAAGGFTQIARVPAAATNTYSYALPATAAGPLPATNYYRINALNESGNVIASTPVISDVVAAAAPVLSVYPNPVHDVLQVKGLNKETTYRVSIVNVAGNAVSAASVANTAAYSFNIAGLSKGVYYVSIVSGGEKILQTKFVKE